MISKINVYDLQLNRVGVLTSWLSLDWTEKFNDDGSCTLEVQMSQDTSKLIACDRMIGIDDSDTLMYLYSVKLEGNKLIAYGSNTYLLDCRVCVLEENTDLEEDEDPHKLNISTTIVTHLQDIASIPIMTYRTSGWDCTTGLMYNGQLNDGTINYQIQEICKHAKTNAAREADIEEIQDGIGYRLRHDKSQKKLVFELYRPDLNRRARYSSKWGNVGDVTYTKSVLDYANVVLVEKKDIDFGPGPVTARIWCWAGMEKPTQANWKNDNFYPTSEGSKYIPEGVERREMLVDSQLEKNKITESHKRFRQRMMGEGLRELAKQYVVENAEFTVNDNVAQLGDIITVSVEQVGVDLQYRVTEVNILSEENKQERKIKVGKTIRMR